MQPPPSAMSRAFVILSIFILAISSTAHPVWPKPLEIRHTCPVSEPVIPESSGGTGCGIPDYVNSTDFGLNKDTLGILSMNPRAKGLDLRMTIKNMPRPNLVVTAWILWALPGPNTPKIFKVAWIASPCAPYTARFSSGLGTDPNVFRYVSPTEAKLRVRLNFNPTYPNEGALTSPKLAFQREVPGIEDTMLKQYPVQRTGKYVPSSASFLRQYDPETGFEELDKNGKPMVVNSPVKALGIALVSHLDRTSHGITEGVFTTDHYDFMFFPFEKSFGHPSKPQK